MPTPKIYVQSVADRDKLKEVLAKVRPRGATMHFSGKHPIWLFKPDEKGGTTVARVIDQSNGDDAVDKMIHEVWDEVKGEQAMTKLRIKKIHPDAVTPEYKSAGAACFDLHAVGIDNETSDGFILPFQSKTFNTGLKFEVPAGYVMLIFSRSGDGFGPHGVRLSNCVGVIDSDYRGEVKVKLRVDDLADGPYQVKNGARIAQAMLIAIPKVEMLEVDELTETARGEGGFGSTGKG